MFPELSLTGSMLSIYCYKTPSYNHRHLPLIIYLFIYISPSSYLFSHLFIYLFGLAHDVNG